MPVYLRVKRMRNDAHVADTFETERYSKVPRLADPVNNEKKNNITTAVPTLFRYIGSQLSDAQVEQQIIDSLEMVQSGGNRKLFWNAQKGTILEEKTKEEAEVAKVDCQVRINTLKRPTTEPQSTDSQSDPCSVKMLKIIDIVPTPLVDTQLADQMNQTHLNPSCEGDAVVGTKQPQSDVDYVYDLYQMESQALRHGRRRSLDSTDSLPLAYKRDEVVLDDGPVDPNADYCPDDEDDSNSESNWRNDYPEEEDDRSSRNSDDDSASIKSSASSDGEVGYYR